MLGLALLNEGLLRAGSAGELAEESDGSANASPPSGVGRLVLVCSFGIFMWRQGWSQTKPSYRLWATLLRGRFLMKYTVPAYRVCFQASVPASILMLWIQDDQSGPVEQRSLDWGCPRNFLFSSSRRYLDSWDQPESFCWHTLNLNIWRV